MEKQSLIIIGAGAAGLMAGYKLADKMDVLILEAHNRIGGRIHTIEQNGNIIEAGAEFVHGKLPVTMDLLQKAEISTEEVAGKMYRLKNGKLIEQENMIEGWDSLMKEIKALEKDTTVIEFLDERYPAPSEIREELIDYAEGFDLAEAGRASIKTLCEEWTKEAEENYRIPSGYTSLTEYLGSEFLKKGGAIHVGMKVQAIRQTDTGIVVINSSGQEFSADKVLVTIPVNALSGENTNAAIAFEPPLPEYQNAAANIGFGKVMKIVMEFTAPFWIADGSFFITNQSVRTWWTQLPDKVPIITGWAGSNAAKALQNLSEETLLQDAFISLSNTFNIPVTQIKEDLVDYYISNMQNDKFICGGYSYATPQSSAAKAILNTPVNDRIFFAGEALYDGAHPGTVEAAFVSANAAAEKILRKQL